MNSDKSLNWSETDAPVAGCSESKSDSEICYRTRTGSCPCLHGRNTSLNGMTRTEGAHGLEQWLESSRCHGCGRGKLPTRDKCLSAMLHDHVIIKFLRPSILDLALLAPRPSQCFEVEPSNFFILSIRRSIRCYTCHREL